MHSKFCGMGSIGMQVSSKMRRAETMYTWYCPACDEMHPLPDGWSFDGNLASPTFSPSFKHTGARFPLYTEEGVGEGEKFSWICHYIITAGKVAYCGDCSHDMKDVTIDMPDLPIWYCDPSIEGA